MNDNFSLNFDNWPEFEKGAVGRKNLPSQSYSALYIDKEGKTYIPIPLFKIMEEPKYIKVKWDAPTKRFALRKADNPDTNTYQVKAYSDHAVVQIGKIAKKFGMLPKSGLLCYSVHINDRTVIIDAKQKAQACDWE